MYAYPEEKIIRGISHDDFWYDREKIMKQMVKKLNKAGLATIFISFLLLILGLVHCSTTSTSYPNQVLARVEVPENLEDLNLPVYADLEDGDEVYYALVIATKSDLNQAGVTYRIIDEYVTGRDYLIATEDWEGAREEAAKTVHILYDDGEHIITRYESRLSEILPDLGFDLKLMSKTPINFTSAEVKAKKAIASAALTKNTIIETMMASITEKNLKTGLELLSGVQPIEVDNAEYTLKTRDTKSGEPVQKATQYVYNELKGMGLSTAFEKWDYLSIQNRNVVGEITGKEIPGEIIVLIAHLDSITNDEDGLAPGADDDASGCAAMLEAADIMRKHQFKRTIRFIFTTGEEQGPLGSLESADVAASQKQKIIAVINLDMVAYTKETGEGVKPRMQVKTRNHKNQGGYAIDKVIADTYLNVVGTYGLDSAINAVFEDDGELSSDHASFWDKKYAAVWLIEYAEAGYLNEKMHTKNDTVNILNMPMFAAITKAALGTAAHLAEVIQ